MTDGITLELCIENCTRLDEAAEKKADRVELCDNLAAGGTTVSYGVAEHAIQYCSAHGISVVTIIRPRGGSFVYTERELAIMRKDINILCGLGTDGIVFGCLTPQGSVDREKTLTLIEGTRTAGAGRAKPDIVFHMAFDHIREDEQMESLRWLAVNGVKRILTHGSSQAKSAIADNYARLRQYIAAAEAGGSDACIEILPGGGITDANFRSVCAALGVTQVHGTRLFTEHP